MIIIIIIIIIMISILIVYFTTRVYLSYDNNKLKENRRIY